MMAAMYDQMGRDQRRGRVSGPVKPRRLGRASSAGKTAEPAEPAKAETTNGASWRDLHWKQQVKIAQDMGADVTTTAEARAFLEAEHG